jgi:AbiU2
MQLHRHVFREVAAITQARDLPVSYFFDYLGETYATSQLIAVRRQADTSSRVCTLGRLLTEIADDPERISREFYVGLWDADGPGGGSAFDSTFAGEVGSHIDPALVRRDLGALSETAERVTGYVDEYVAHKDARAKAGVPAFEDLNAAIDSIGKLYDKYNNALTGGSSHGSLIPILDPGWKAVFRQPWIES